MSDPMFVMSMYANKTELYKAKARYYVEKSDALEAKVTTLESALNDVLYSGDMSECKDKAEAALKENSNE